MADKDKVSVALFGDTGMVGQELERILKGHDLVEIKYRQNSKREEGNLDDCVLAFLATKEPESMQLAPGLLDKGKKVIDMSGVFRLDKRMFEMWYGLKHECPGLLENAVYGLPAFFKDKIKDAQLMANPGCYSTAVILAVNPIADLIVGGINGGVIITATSGISGARKNVEKVSNDRTYNYGRLHRHVPEMEVYGNVGVTSFTPVVLESVFKGINANIVGELKDELSSFETEEVKETIKKRINNKYRSSDNVLVVEDTKEKEWGTKDVNDTHRCLIKVYVFESNFARYVLLSSMLDNLGKGAASQAVENMNIRLGLPRLYGIGNAYSTDMPPVNTSK